MLTELRRLVTALYEPSLKLFVVSTLEMYLSLLLVVSLFESPDDSKRDDQELQTTYMMAWVPLICAAVLVNGDKLLGKYGPEPDNFDRNLAGLKIAMWVYAFVELVVDKDMAIKKGPALFVAVIFCLVDMLRFHMEAMRLIYDDDEKEEEIDRLANMVIAALEDTDDESAFKHAVREVIQRGRIQSVAKKDEEEDADTFLDSPLQRNSIIPQNQLTQSDHEDTTEYGTMDINI